MVISHLKLVAEAPQASVKKLAESAMLPFSLHGMSGFLEALPLARDVINSETQTKSRPMLAWLLVGVAHMLMIASVLFFKPQEIEKKEEPKPILVSLVSHPAPMPELVPVVPPPLEIKQAKPIEKKVVKKIEKQQPEPVPKIQEQVVEQQVTQPMPQEVAHETNATNVVEVPKAVVKETPKPLEPEPVIEPPRFGVAYLNNPAPNYPPMSRRLGEEGRVLLRVLVSIEGQAESVELEKTSGFERLDQAAIEVVKMWRFIPAKKGKEALSAKVLVPVKFTLH